MCTIRDNRFNGIAPFWKGIGILGSQCHVMVVGKEWVGIAVSCRKDDTVETGNDLE